MKLIALIVLALAFGLARFAAAADEAPAHHGPLYHVVSLKFKPDTTPEAIKAVDFADQIASRTESFPRGYYFLVDQLNRAALSVAANLAEGNGRFTKPDRKHFCTIARMISGLINGLDNRAN